MKRVIIAVLSCIATVSFAGLAYETEERIDNLVNGSLSFETLKADAATISGVATFTGIPKFTSVQAGGSTNAVTGVIRIPVGYVPTNSTLLKVTVGSDTYVVPAFIVP